MKITVAIILLSLCCFAQDKDRDRDSSPERSATSASCVSTYFTGNVKRALPFVQPLGSGLSYRLAPFRQNATDANHEPEFTGWTIEIAYLKQKGDMEREFSWVMTPPYRQWNARQLNTSYGHSIADVLKAGHAVYFPVDTLDYALADKLVTRILWRSTPPEFHEAAHELPRIPIGSADMTLLGQQLGGDQSAPSSIDMISFKVELTVPKSVKLIPELERRAKPAECPVSPLIPMLREMAQ